jgi:phage/plasmid-associated DNA primase
MKIQNSNVAEFFDREMGVGEMVPRSDLYQRYLAFCESEGYRSRVGKKTFYNDIRTLFPNDVTEKVKNGEYYIIKGNIKSFDELVRETEEPDYRKDW